MENERKAKEKENVSVDSKAEEENFQSFISAMARIVEKYGPILLREMDCVA